MATVDKSANNTPLVSRDDVVGPLRKALSIYVGIGKRYSVKELCRGTGVDARVIETWQSSGEDYREPKLSAILSVAKFLGPDFTADILAIVGQGAFALPTGAIDCAELMKGATSSAGLVVACLADGDCSADDARVLPAVGRRMVADGMALAAVRS
jgi:hypothetical protein